MRSIVLHFKCCYILYIVRCNYVYISSNRSIDLFHLDSDDIDLSKEQRKIAQKFSDQSIAILTVPGTNKNNFYILDFTARQRISRRTESIPDIREIQLLWKSNGDVSVSHGYSTLSRKIPRFFYRTTLTRFLERNIAGSDRCKGRNNITRRKWEYAVRVASRR